MSRSIIVLATLGIVMAGPAFARNCPQQMAAIDKALESNPSVDAAKLAEAKRLRAEGEELHKAGKHPESEAALARAREILGVKM